MSSRKKIDGVSTAVRLGVYLLPLYFHLSASVLSRLSSLRAGCSEEMGSLPFEPCMHRRKLLFRVAHYTV